MHNPYSSSDRTSFSTWISSYMLYKMKKHYATMLRIKASEHRHSTARLRVVLGYSHS